MKFYIVMALLWRYRFKGILSFAFIACVASLLWFTPSFPATFSGGWVDRLLFAVPYLVFMFIGVVFNQVLVGRLVWFWGLGYGGIFLLAFISTVWVREGGSELIFNYTSALIVFLLAAFWGKWGETTSFMRSAILRFLAKISYPLYAVHGALGYVSLRLLVNTEVPPILSLLLVTTFVIGLSFLIHLIVEESSRLFARKMPTVKFNLYRKKLFLSSE